MIGLLPGRGRTRAVLQGESEPDELEWAGATCATQASACWASRVQDNSEGRRKAVASVDGRLRGKPRPFGALHCNLGELTGRGDMPTGTQLGVEIRLSPGYCLPSNDGTERGKFPKFFLFGGVMHGSARLASGPSGEGRGSSRERRSPGSSTGSMPSVRTSKEISWPWR